MPRPPRPAQLTADAEAALGRAALRGDRQARNALAARHLGLAYRLARKYHAPGLDAADFRQEAALALLSAAGTWNPDRPPAPGRPPASFTTYAWWQIRAALRAVLARARRADLPAEDIADVEAAPDPEPAERPAALAALPPDQQRVLFLRYIAGWPGADVADFLGLPVDQVYAQARRAKAAIDPPAPRPEPRLRKAAHRPRKPAPPPAPEPARPVTVRRVAPEDLPPSPVAVTPLGTVLYPSRAQTDVSLAA